MGSSNFSLDIKQEEKMTLALLFPGQGSQFVGMGKEIAGGFPIAAKFFQEADLILGFPLSKLMWEGPEEDLKTTINAQPAIVVTSLACWAVLSHYGIKPDFVAGHSVGEYAALVANNVLTAADAIRLVRKRGECMYRSGQKRPGAMAAVLGLETAVITAICEEFSQGGMTVGIANFNAPGQVVISGDVEAVEKTIPLLSLKGAKRVIKLSVSGAFHSSLMADAKEEFDQILDAVAFSNANVPIVSNVTASPLRYSSEICDAMKRQIRESVRWEEIIRWLTLQGIDVAVEVGAGQVLSGLVKKINKQIRVLNVQDSVSLRETVKQLESLCQLNRRI